MQTAVYPLRGEGMLHNYTISFSFWYAHVLPQTAPVFIFVSRSIDLICLFV